MEIKIIQNQITRKELGTMAEVQFGEWIKGVVDIERGVMAVGGELHADMEAVLLEQGSRQGDVWGINLYPNQAEDDWIEFNSMINVRPSQGNRSRGVENPEIQEKIRDVVKKWVV
jgi:hypothetical protein